MSKGKVHQLRHQGDRDRVKLTNTLSLVLEERNKIQDEARNMFMGMIRAIVQTLEERDAYTHGHSLRVTEYSLIIGKGLGLTDSQMNNLELAALFHDIGKIGIPDHLLLKPGKLSPDEMYIMQTHPVKSQKILENIPGMEDVVPAVRHHHERLDGKGYPDGIKGEQIPLGARIILVADTFDAMTSTRAYRNALSPEVAYEELVRCSGTQFDPDLVEIFLKHHRVFLQKNGHVFGKKVA